MDADVRHTSLNSCFIFGRKVSDSRTVVTFFFHLMAWGIYCGFVYSFMVKQACFIEQCSSSFLEVSFSVVPYWDFCNYLYNYSVLSLSYWLDTYQETYPVFE